MQLINTYFNRNKSTVWLLLDKIYGFNIIKFNQYTYSMTEVSWNTVINNNTLSLITKEQNNETK